MKGQVLRSFSGVGRSSRRYDLEMSKKFLHFHRAWFDSREEKEIVAALRSGWSTTGPRTARFEQRIADYLGVKYAVGLNSCTAALHLGLLVAGVGKGDEVITTSFTFAATVNVIEHLGARPVFADIRSDTLNIDEKKIAPLISRRTRAIMPVHFAGYPCEMRAITSLARKRRLKVVGDCAHALESEYGGRKVGAWGDVSAFSFYATKNITTGEGGMLATNDKALADRVRVLRLHGMSKDAWKRYDRSGSPHYDVVYPGYKYNMSDLPAALGLIQLRKIERFWRLRRKHRQLYSRYLSGVPGLEIFPDSPRVKNAYHLYGVFLDEDKLGIDRDQVMVRMQERGIGVGVHFRAIHLQPYYRKKYGYKSGDLPNTERAGGRELSLPFYPRLKAVDIKRVAETLLSVIKA